MTLTVSNTTCINKPEVTWWNSADGQNPCEMLVELLQRCHPDWVLGNMPAVPQKPRQICSDEAVAAGEATDYNKCCCNSVAYSLRQACWSCQWGQLDPDPVLGARPTVGEYMQCSGETLFGLGLDEEPGWTRLPLSLADTWSFVNAERFALSSSGGAITPPSTSTPGTDPALTGTARPDPSPSAPRLGTAEILAIIAAAAVFVVLCVFGLWISVRRARLHHAMTRLLDPIPPPTTAENSRNGSLSFVAASEGLGGTKIAARGDVVQARAMGGLPLRPDLEAAPPAYDDQLGGERGN